MTFYSQDRNPTIVDEVSFGTSWQNKDNIMSENGQYAITQTTSSSVVSNFIKPRKFNFNIPSNATILGIQAYILRHAEGLGGTYDNTSDYALYVSKLGTNIGTTHANPVYWTGGDDYFWYGNNSDLWGTTWTPAEINSEYFGLNFVVALKSGGTLQKALIDNIHLIVYYDVSFPSGKITDVYANSKLIEQNDVSIATPDAVANGGTVNLSANIKNNSSVAGTLAIRFVEITPTGEQSLSWGTFSFSANETKSIPSAANPITMPNRDFQFYVKVEHEDV